MAPDGLRAGLCALFLALPISTTFAGPAEDRDAAITTRLTVQTALQRGRELLARNSFEAAVFTLESQLDKINGSREYLATLRDAYRGYVQELRLANRSVDAELYQRRLLVLDPGAVLDAPAPRAPAKQQVEEKARPAVRLQKEDEPAPSAKALVTRAGQEFDAGRFAQAGKLFDQAAQLDREALADCRESWAYCKLHQVVQQLNQPATGATACPDLEQEVRLALSLAPTSKVQGFGKDLLERIAERRGGNAVAEAPAVPVRHSPRPVDGWNVAETTNFRIVHRQSNDLAEKVARVAEKTRLEMHRKWFGNPPEDWNPKCDIVLHANAEEYARSTGESPQSPGHSRIESDGPRVMSRRMHLRCDDANMVIAVLPHETTHVVLAGQFGNKPVPRWADEGMAVLTEPREKIERHLRMLPEHRKNRLLINLDELMQMEEYPDPQHVGAFYGESVSLVEFLSAEKGPQVFTQFVRSGLQRGYLPALQQFYGFKDFNDLQRRWIVYALGDRANPVKVAAQGP